MFYVFHGDDAFSRDEELANLSQKMGDPQMADLNTTHLDGQTVDWEEVLYHCSTIPFLAERRLVIVRGLLTRLTQRNRGKGESEFLENLVGYLPDLPPTTRLVFIEDRQLPGKHAVITLARVSDKGYERAFTKPTGNALTRWVQQRVKQAGGEIDGRTAQVLCAYVEGNLHQLDTEIEKLVAYTNGERPITEADVQTLTPQARQANIFDMVNAMGRRDGKTASLIYHDLLATGSHPLSLLAMITRQFRLMIQVKELTDQYHTYQAIARELGQSPYPIRKIQSQSTNYTMEQLHAVYHKLLDVDVAIKTGRVEPTLALDTLIAGLSRVP
jgi:DNA polymerase-3 subunit delta